MRKYLVLIPARGGSKGVPKKNIYPINGRPMIYYTLDVLMQIEFLTEICVSTEDEEIKRIVEAYPDELGKIYIIDRPSKLAEDTTSTEDVAFHAINYMKEKYNLSYQSIITMAPNLPLRTVEMVKGAIESFENMGTKFDAQNSFLKTTDDMFVKCEDGEFKRLFPDAPRRRQEREPLYIDKGSIIITKIDALEKYNSLWGHCLYGYEIPEEFAVDVHDMFEIDLLNFIYERK